MTKKGAKAPHFDTDLYYALYVALGKDRSIKGVLDCGRTLRVATPSLKTLERYSRVYHWQQRVRDFEAGIAARNEELIADTIAQMNDRQAAAGVALQQLVVDAVEEINSRKPAHRNIAPAQLASMLDTGVKVERLARGQATERRDLAVAFVNGMIPTLAQLFVSVNMIGDPDTRADQFGEGLNEIAKRFVINAD